MKKASFGEKVFGGKIFTIPNLMSMFRLVLIPVILILYIKEKYVAAGVTFLISGITDVIDGWVARRFNMVSDLGKALDPAADKLTQAAALLCISFRHNEVIPLMVLF
ncbi:MAG: CDP-alcohol phosphatidyltransferase family protein, partial [Clostridia bacterium]|nr:CDP-alcohol phosphatidyltransferase family protein [Clostridia bacterium]